MFDSFFPKLFIIASENYLLKKATKYIVSIFFIIAFHYLNSMGFGYSLYMDGNYEYIDCGNDSSLNLTSEGSFGAWVKLDSIPEDSYYKNLILSKGIQFDFSFLWNLGSYNITAYEGNYNINVYTTDNSTYDNINIQIPIPDFSEWHHIFATFNNGILKLYFDGIFITESSSIFQNLNLVDHPLMLGGHLANEFLKGYIDNVQIWEIELTEEEIHQNLCRKLNGDEPGLVGYWCMDEGERNTSYDLSIYQNHGYLINMEPVAWNVSTSPVGEFGSIIQTTSQVNIGQLGGEILITINSIPDDNNYLLAYQYGTLDGSISLLEESFPEFFLRRSYLTWGIREIGEVNADIIFDYSNVSSISNPSEIEIIKRDDADDYSWEEIIESARDDDARTITVNNSDAFYEYSLGIQSGNYLELYQPENGTSEHSFQGVTLIWLSDYDNFDIFLGTDYPPSDILNGNNLTESYFETGNLAPDQLYFWRIIAHTTNEEDLISPIWNFKTIGKLYINELVTSNASINLDPDNYSFCDWIELYNPQDYTINLGGLYLSDDFSNLTKWQIPGGIYIEPHGYKNFWADETNEGTHTNFKLNNSGEEIVLYKHDGIIIDSKSYNEFDTDISYGIKPGINTNWSYFGEPTPDHANISDGYHDLNYNSSPQFSINGGHYYGTQYIELSSENPSGIIFYTLDGSKPTSSSNIYSSPIIIDTTTVIRARVFSEDLLPSETTSNTYLINETENLPVISIYADPEYFWNDSYGIYVLGDNYIPGWYSTANFYQDWERPIGIEYYNIAGNNEFNQKAGIKIFGGRSRLEYEQKSFAIYCRDKYGSEQIDYQLFNTKNIDEYKTIILRDSGYPDHSDTMFRDAMSQYLVKDIDVDIQAYQPSVVFINGGYWGIYNIREKLNEHYLASNHGIDPDNVDILELDQIVIEGDAVHYSAMINFIESNDMNLSENYEYIKTQMDVDEFINYQISEIYYANSDWPFHNIKYWRPKTSEGKWRWMIYDTDFGFGLRGNYSHNTLTQATNESGTWSTFLLRSLLYNESFKNEFIQRFSSHLNITFAPDRVINIIDSLKSNIEYEMPNHIDRWGTISSMNEWEDNVEIMREFANQRPLFVRNHILEKFNLSGTAELSLNIIESGAGRVEINDVQISEDSFNGIYFLDIPINLRAIPNQGYQFVCWQGIPEGENDSLSVIIMGDSTITAVFEPAAFDEIVINEIHYNPSSYQGIDDDFEFIELYNSGDSSVDLSGFTLSQGIEFTFPQGSVINENEYIVIAKNANTYIELDCQIYQWTDGNLSNGGENILLRDDNENQIDFVSYDDEGDWTSIPDGNGPSLELIDPVFDNNFPENWKSSLVFGGTPGKPNQMFSFNLYINEFMASNDNTIADPQGDYDDWIEIYNAGSDSINIGGLYITDDLSELTKWQIPMTESNSTTIHPEEFLLLWADEDSEDGVLHTEIKLSADGEDIGLTAIDGTTIIDSYVFGLQTTDISEGRYPDGNDQWELMPIPSPGTTNISSNSLPIISDLTQNPLTPSSSDEVNVTVTIIDDNYLESTLIKYDIGSGFQEIIMHDDGEHGDGDANDDIFGGYIPSLISGTLVNYFIEATDDLFAVSTFPENAPELNVQYLVDYEAPLLFINEFMADNESTISDPQGEFDDWIEIYNASTQLVDIGGMYITDNLSSLNEWYKIPVSNPDSTNLEPGSFLLLWADEDIEDGINHIGIKLSSGGEQVGLFAFFGTCPVDTLTFSSQSPDISFGRYPDGYENFYHLNSATPGSSNILIQSPSNISISIVSDSVLISWNPVIGADYFNIYASNDPYLEIENWTLENSNIISTSWSQLLSEQKKYYFVAAVIDSRKLKIRIKEIDNVLK